MQTCLRTTQWLRGNTNTFLWPLRSDLIMISWWAHGPGFRANEALIRIFSRHIQVLISFKRGLRYELNVMGNGRCEGSYEESLRVTRASQKLGSCDAMSQMSGSRPASEHNWSIFSVSNFSIHYQRLSCYGNPDLKMTPASGIVERQKFNLLSLMLRRKIWRATLWHEYYMSYWHVTHGGLTSDLWPDI